MLISVGQKVSVLAFVLLVVLLVVGVVVVVRWSENLNVANVERCEAECEQLGLDYSSHVFDYSRLTCWCSESQKSVKVVIAGGQDDDVVV